MQYAIFNEDALGQEIKRVWGEYGAHYEVYKMILEKAKSNPSLPKLNGLKELLVEYLDYSNEMDNECKVRVTRSTNKSAEAEMLLKMLTDGEPSDLTPGSPDSTNPVHSFLVEENRRLKERIEVLEDALNELKNVSKMYLGNTEKHPDFIMDKDSTITFYFKTATKKATEALNQK